MDELVKRLRYCSEETSGCGLCALSDNCVLRRRLIQQAADTIEELSAKIEQLQCYVNNISKLPDCNTCLKKGVCEFVPRAGEYCRINCPAWLGNAPKEVTNEHA